MVRRPNFYRRQRQGERFCATDWVFLKFELFYPPRGYAVLEFFTYSADKLPPPVKKSGVRKFRGARATKPHSFYSGPRSAQNMRAPPGSPTYFFKGDFKPIVLPAARAFPHGSCVFSFAKLPRLISHLGDGVYTWLLCFLHMAPVSAEYICDERHVFNLCLLLRC